MPLILLMTMALSLLTKRSGFYKANAFLAFAYVSTASSFFYLRMLYENGLDQSSVFYHSQFVFLSFSGPCLRFFFTIKTGHEMVFRLRNVFHLLPLLPGLGYYFFYRVAAMFFVVSGSIVFLVYVFLIVRMTARHQTGRDGMKRGPDPNSQILLIVFTIVTMSLYIATGDVPLPSEAYWFTGITGCVCTAILALWQFHHSELFYPTRNGNHRNVKYVNSSLSDQQLTKYAGQIIQLLKTEQCYLNPDLTERELAEMIHIPPYQLSQVLNREMRVSFNNLINRYRIEMASEFLASPENNQYTIEYIATQCGFKNRVTFFNAFKKFMKKSPKEIRNRA